MLALTRMYKEYIANLPKMDLHIVSGAKHWTESVKLYWARKGDDSGFQVWANRINHNSKNCIRHEYMLDLIWMAHSSRTRHIELALECEWQTRMRYQEHDFRKLVFLKAKQKVFIFQCPRYEEPQNRVKEFVKYIRECRITQVPEEKYLLISHRDNRGKGLVEIVNGFIAYPNGDFDRLSEQSIEIE